MVLVDEFLDQGESLSGGAIQQRPWSVAWLKDLIEFYVPELDTDEKRVLVGYFKPILDNAARTNLDNMQIVNMLKQYQNIWGMIFLYEKRWRKHPRLLVFKEVLYAAYEQQLNRSKNFGMMRLVFQPENIIRQFMQKISGGGRKLGFFKGRKEPEENEYSGRGEQ